MCLKEWLKERIKIETIDGVKRKVFEISPYEFCPFFEPKERKCKIPKELICWMNIEEMTKKRLNKAKKERRKNVRIPKIEKREPLEKGTEAKDSQN